MNITFLAFLVLYNFFFNLKLFSFFSFLIAYWHCPITTTTTTTKLHFIFAPTPSLFTSHQYPRLTRDCTLQRLFFASTTQHRALKWRVFPASPFIIFLVHCFRIWSCFVYLAFYHFFHLIFYFMFISFCPWI
ncbi:hypothetical protein FIBSPDRAFT_396253 [Athelia psychrophila]|uniref:Uncharacterized protein n=1 Tax=Athelia psychrophila TaxID=1759441 RepID=A0A166NP09_9AGAM|nr:hypothetical protein FIBSPDRAFT_396253 [Fibularhizoctonia sp. CBS 109695]